MVLQEDALRLPCASWALSCLMSCAQLAPQVGRLDPVGSGSFPAGVLCAVRAGAPAGPVRARHAAALQPAGLRAARLGAVPGLRRAAQALPRTGRFLPAPGARHAWLTREGGRSGASGVVGCVSREAKWTGPGLGRCLL